MSAITLDSISVPMTTGDWVSVKSDSSITKSTTSVANKIEKSAPKTVSKKVYDKHKNNAVILTQEVGWFYYTATSERYEVWKVKEFKETYKTSGSTTTKYRYWTVKYLSKYKLRYVATAYTFTKQPSAITITYQDLDIEDENVGTDVGRDRTTGKIKRNRVRTNVRTIECEFPPLTHAEVSAMMPYLNAENSYTGFLNLTYTDAYKGTHTIKCYAGDRSFEAGPFGYWLNGKVTFVEQ